MSASGDHSLLFVHDLAVSECQSLSNLSDGGLHIQGLARQSSGWIILGDVQRNPFASLLLVESENGKGSGEISPGSKGSSVDTSNVSSIAMEFSRIVILEDDMTNIRVESILNFLSNFVSVNLENVLGVGDFNDGVWVELALERLRIISLINLLNLQKTVLDVVDVVFALVVVSGHLEVINSLLQGVHFIRPQESLSTAVPPPEGPAGVSEKTQVE